MPRQSAVLLCLALATGSLARSLYIESSASGSGDMSGDVSGSAEYSGSADMSGSGEASGFEPVDCTTASDGLYSLGPCETRFLTCSGGIARIMDCPAGLVYNAAIIACDWPANVCLGVDSSASGSGDLSASGSGEDSGSGEASGFEPVDCATAPDGLYSLGECMPQFLTCSGGIARIMDCPAGLFYNATIVACDWPANGCLGVDFSGSGSGDFSGSGDMSGDFSGSASGSGDFSGSGSGEESGSGDGSAFEPVDCATAPDGLYALGSCETRFLTCSGGIARIMDCPADLIYRSSIEACDWPANAGCA